MSKSQKKPPRGPGHGQAMTGEKAKDFKGAMKQLMAYLGKYKISVAIVIIFAMASTVFAIVGPKIMGTVTTALFEGAMNLISATGQGIDFAFVLKTIIFLVVIYGISSLFMYLQGFVMSTVSMKTTYNLRKDISEKINRLPLSYFDKKNFGEVLSHITNDVDAITQSLNQSITQIITSATMIVGILAMMFSISWQMTLVALCIIPASAVFMVFIVKRSQKHFMAQQQYLGHVNGHIEEMYGSHVVVKAFNAEEESIGEFDKLNDTLYHSAWKSQFLSGLMHPVMGFIGNLGYVAVCMLGGYLAINGRITVGNIQAFIQYVRQFTQPIAQVANISNILQQTAAAAERVFEFLGEEEEIEDNKDPARIDNIEGRVAFEHVKFGYQEDKIIIKDFSCVVQPGQKVAIVGPTGAGKTTLMKLLMRFYDINDGQIKIDGVSIQNFTRYDLRSLFGMVTQDTWLYHGSIMDNIRYGRLDATDEQVIAAAKTAQAHHFITTLPNGYEMELNEESSNISQGQKQLLTIARAVLADPQILILDEATSSVDTRTEILIQKAMDGLMQGRTSFVIAHRLSTIRDADVILVMNNGDIVEQGTHEGLLAQGGFYADLYNSQFANQAG